METLIGLGVLVVLAWCAFELLGAMLKIIAFVLLLLVAWWLLAPVLHWPTPWQLISVLWLP